jgi:hypothetical protein
VDGINRRLYVSTAAGSTSGAINLRTFDLAFGDFVAPPATTTWDLGWGLGDGTTNQMCISMNAAANGQNVLFMHTTGNITSMQVGCESNAALTSLQLSHDAVLTVLNTTIDGFYPHYTQYEASPGPNTRLNATSAANASQAVMSYALHPGGLNTSLHNSSSTTWVPLISAQQSGVIDLPFQTTQHTLYVRVVHATKTAYYVSSHRYHPRSHMRGKMADISTANAFFRSFVSLCASLVVPRPHRTSWSPQTTML